LALLTENEERMSAVSSLFERSFSRTTPGGVSRMAALGFFVLALIGALVAIGAPQFAQWAGVVLLSAICVAGLLLLYAAMPFRVEGSEEARRAANIAASSNIAWAVTARDGAVLDCNTAYRFLAGAGDGEPPAPPQLAFPGERPAAALYRLSRAAIDGRAREENFESETGQKLTAAVRPLKRGEAAWWFTPRLPEAVPPKGADPAEKRIPSALIRFNDFFRNAPFGVAITLSNGKVSEANQPFADFFGLGAHAQGMRVTDLVTPNERAAAIDRISRASNGEVGHDPVEIHSASSAASTAQLYTSPFMATPEGEEQSILYLVDTSEQKALETQFAQSQKMQAIGQLAGGVAHDFNNLLQAIMGNCDLLLMRHSAEDPSFEEINEVRQNSVRAAGLVRQLLAFSRQQTLQPKVLALTDTLTELSMLLRRLLGERCELKIDHEADLWAVRADEGQISNAIMNLAVNARDAMPPEGGAVTIRTANFHLTGPKSVGTATMPAGEYVQIDVTDNGLGIAKENISKIFEPFFTTKPTGQGTGLGLSTVYGIVKQTGGFITVDSEVGKGTVFLIFLPRHIIVQGVQAEPPVEPEAAQPAASADITGQETVLLVEDEEAVRSFAARALRMRGYTVIEASGGEIALDAVRTHQGTIDLLVTDVVMPNMEGPTLVRAASRLRPEMRIIFMSGYAEDAFRKSEDRDENMHFLPKPFGLKQLVAKVKAVLSEAPPGKVTPYSSETKR
jgi:two-component system cell cycle sensor histidine kinase/response regulator CckA